MRPHPAKADDLCDLQILLESCGMNYAGIEAQIERFFIVRDISGIIGCAYAEQDGAVALLKVIAVSQRARSAGLGELLLNALVAEFRQRGVQTLVLRPMGAGGFFARQGFTPISLNDAVRLSRLQDLFEGDGGDTVMQAAL